MSKLVECVPNFSEGHRTGGVNVTGTKIIGLPPMQALLDVAEFYLRLDGFDRKQVLEDNL